MLRDAGRLGPKNASDNIVAIILLDFCVESLLKTALTASAVSPNKRGDPKFSELWNIVDEQIVKQRKLGVALGQLPFRIAMENLHRQRNSAQHEGKTPHRADVESDANLVREFASQIYERLFGLDYHSLSLTDLVRNIQIRGLLIEAEKFHAAEKFFESVAKSAEALTRMLRIANKSGPKSDLRLYDLDRGIRDPAIAESIEKIGKALEDTNERIDKLMHIVMGLDFKSYARYRHFAPAIHITAAGNAHCTYVNRDSMPPEESKFILEFALENILRMEEYGLEWHALG